MPIPTFGKMREAVARDSSFSKQDKERAVLEITLVEHLTDAINDLRNAVVLSALATGSIAAFAGTVTAQTMGVALGEETAARALASLAGRLGLV